MIAKYDCYMELRLVIHRKITITAATPAEAKIQAQALADAWMPHQLTSTAPPFPATEAPAIEIEVTVIREPEPKARKRSRRVPAPVGRACPNNPLPPHTPEAHAGDWSGLSV